MSLILRPSCEALSRSITTVAWGESILRSVFRKMKRPVASASCRNFCATSFSGSNGPVVLTRTGWAGRGAGQRRRLEGHDLRAGDPAELLLHDRLELVEVSVRLSHGFSTKPRDRLAGTSSWKTWSVSLWLAPMR